MTLDKFFNVLGAIVTVTLVFVIVSNRYSAAVIREFFGGFANSLRAASGR